MMVTVMVQKHKILIDPWSLSDCLVHTDKWHSLKIKLVFSVLAPENPEDQYIFIFFLIFGWLIFSNNDREEQGSHF